MRDQPCAPALARPVHRRQRSTRWHQVDRPDAAAPPRRRGDIDARHEEGLVLHRERATRASTAGDLVLAVFDAYIDHVLMERSPPHESRRRARCGDGRCLRSGRHCPDARTPADRRTLHRFCAADDGWNLHGTGPDVPGLSALRVRPHARRSKRLFGYGLTRVAPSAATTLTLAEPAIAALLAVVIVGERLPAIGWAGLAGIGASLLVLSLAPATQARAANPSRSRELPIGQEV